MKLSIIIVNWNTKDLLKNCLESLAEDYVRLGGCEVIVVDNGSDDGSVSMVKKLRVKNYELKIIENKENLGFSIGNNIGIKKAKGDYIMLLNTDTIIGKGSIAKLISYLDCHDEVAIVGPKLLNSDGTVQANCGRFPDLIVSFVMLFKEHFGGSDFVRTSPEKSMFVDWLMGAAFMTRKDVFDKVGGLDEEIFMYMEEVDWFYRANKVGFKAYFLKEAEITHLGRGSSKGGKKDPILNIYKGLIRFYKKHKSPLEIFTLELMLKSKAVLALLLGFISGNNYLKETYGQALKIS